jgi:hypothetical protein
MMKRSVLLLNLLLITATLATAQMKVANYAYGEPGTDTYEHLSFWVKDGKRGEVSYTYGRDRKEVNLQYTGRSSVNGKTGFTVQFPNKTTLSIIPNGNQLKVTNPKATYAKTFAWEYEGPVNGIGTFCDVCTQDEKEAFRLLQAYYFR